MNIREIILDILFPPLCFGCRKYNKNYLCENCWTQIEINSSFFCPTCQNRIPIYFNQQNLSTRPPCHPDAQYLLAPAADYRNKVIQNLIQELKFNRLTSAIGPIKKIIDEYLLQITRGESQIYFLENFIIIPIPISTKRLRERGFNQAELIADHISKKINLPILRSVILKPKDNKKQSELKKWEERKSNVENCFSVSKPELIRSKNIILVDDIFTSGATIKEAVKVLKKSGVRKIIAFTLARARSA